MEPSDDDDHTPGGDPHRADGRDAPVPPHERAWRHPAEVGEWNRDRIRLVAEPPPLSRRLTAVIAGASIVLSAAVLVVSIPRLENSGDEAPVSTGEVRGVTTTAAAPSGAPDPVAALPAGHFASGGGVAGNYLVAAADDVGGLSGALIAVGNRTPLAATVVHVDELLGVALLEVAEQALGAESLVAAARTSPESGDEVFIEDADGRPTIRCRVGVGTTRKDGLLPLDVDAKVRGVRRAYGADGALLGVAVHHHHATWLVTSERLSRLLDAAGVAATTR